MGLRWLAFAGVTLAVASAPHAALAICGSPPPITVLPHRGALAPPNTRVWVTVPKDWRQGSEFLLRGAPTPGTDARVKIVVRQTFWITGDVERVELLPSTPLAPNTAYEVWSSRAELLGAFKTGAATDSVAPTWSGLERGTAYKPPPPPSASGRGNRIITLSDECGEYRLRLVAKDVATDDTTPQDDIRYALWAGPTGRPLDYGAPPLAWVTLDLAQQTMLARPGTPVEYVIGYGNTDGLDDDIALPATRPLLVGVRAIDLAGNATAPSEITVK